MRKIHLSAGAPKPIGPYSQAVEVGGALYCSGQIALNPSTGEMIGQTAGEQAQQVMLNIEAVLQTAGYAWSDIVKSTIFLVDMNDFAAVNEVYGAYFRENPPARSTVAVAQLPKGARVEVEVLAVRR